MNEQFKRQAEQFMNAAKDVRIPEQFQAFAEDSVSKSRDAFDKAASVAKDQAKVAEDILLATQAGAKSIGTKMLDNTMMNTTAAFDAAHAIVKAKTVPEAARLQMEFAQKQMSIASAQMKELFDLSTRVTQQAFENGSAVAAKGFEQAKKGR